MQNLEEFNVLLSTFLEILNQQAIASVGTKCFDYWISTKSGDSLAVKSILQTSSMVVADQEIVSAILEVTLNSYFCNKSEEEVSWSEASSLLRAYPPKQTELEQMLVSKGCVLTLHGFLMSKMTSSMDSKALLNTSIDWLQNIKIR